MQIEPHLSGYRDFVNVFFEIDTWWYACIKSNLVNMFFSFEFAVNSCKCSIDVSSLLHLNDSSPHIDKMCCHFLRWLIQALENGRKILFCNIKSNYLRTILYQSSGKRRGPAKSCCVKFVFDTMKKTKWFKSKINSNLEAFWIMGLVNLGLSTDYPSQNSLAVLKKSRVLRSSDVLDQLLSLCVFGIKRWAKS